MVKGRVGPPPHLMAVPVQLDEGACHTTRHDPTHDLGGSGVSSTNLATQEEVSASQQIAIARLNRLRRPAVDDAAELVEQERCVSRYRRNQRVSAERSLIAVSQSRPTEGR